MELESLVQRTHQTLMQGSQLIAGLDRDVYTHSDQSLFPSGVGVHVRHILDYYQCALTGFRTGIDYCKRQRDPRIESDVEIAVSKFTDTVNELKSLIGKLESDHPVAVLEAESSGVQKIASTLGRELHYLLNHTIHHYAIVALILRMQNVEVPDDFGVAPSTWQYWKSRDESGSPTRKNPPE